MDTGGVWSDTGGLGTPEVWPGTIPVLCLTGGVGATLPCLLPKQQVLGCSGKPSPGCLCLPDAIQGDVDPQQDFGKDFGACWLAGRQLCPWRCPVPRGVLHGPLPFPGSPELPRERGSLAVGGAAGSVPATCSAAVPVTALRFLGFFAPSCCMIPLESQRDHGVWVQDRDEEQEFSSRSCQDF